MEIMALNIRQPWAELLISGKKSIETRLWQTNYRGPLMIVASLKELPDRMAQFGYLRSSLPLGKAVGIVDLWRSNPMTKDDEEKACCELYDGAFSWVMKHARRIEPFAVKGKLKLYKVNCPEDVEYEYQERLAILIENNPGMCLAHAKNKAIKEIRER